jgi:hypothetical protein
MKLKELMEKDLINGSECATLILQGYQDVTPENIDKLNLQEERKKIITEELGWKKKIIMPEVNFLLDDQKKIKGVEIKYPGKIFEGSKATYTYVKLTKSNRPETDFYGYTKCKVDNNTYTTLVSISLGNDVSFGEYTFPYDQLEHKVARFLQNIARRLQEKIREQE